MNEAAELPKDYTLEEVATALRVSTRWVRDRIREGKERKGPFVEHQRKGHKITFSVEQVEKLRAATTKAPAPEASVTTGRKKKSS